MEYLQKAIVTKRLSLLCLVLVAFCSITFSQKYVTEEVTEFVVSPDAAGNFTYYMITAGDATLMVNSSGNITAGSQTDSTFTYFYYDGTRLIAAYNFTGGSKVDVTDRVVYASSNAGFLNLQFKTSTNLSFDEQSGIRNQYYFILKIANNTLYFEDSISISIGLVIDLTSLLISIIYFFLLFFLIIHNSTITNWLYRIIYIKL